MTGDRIPCCVKGCKRTFKAELARGSEFLMCGKHWKAVGARERGLHKEAARLASRLMRKWPDPAKMPKSRVRIVIASISREERRWRVVMAEAQRLQGAGFFAPRPRPRKAGKVSGKNPVDRVAKGFEGEFQRLKTLGNRR